MLTLIDATGPYTLPTGWHEVPTRQYCDLDRLQLATVEARASYFAGRPIQVNGLVADALAWMLHQVPTGGPPDYPLELGKETFLQVETIRGLLLSQPLHQCYAQVYGLFVTRLRAYRYPEFRQDLAAITAAACLDAPATETYPAVAHCLRQLRELDESFAALYEPDTTESGRRARAAGSDKLAMFGHLNIARHYAQAFSITIDAIYQTPWVTVALWLLQDRMSAEIQDTLAQQPDQ
jgi:hypothetical protein